MPPSFVQWGSSVGFDIEPTIDPSTYTSTFDTNPAEGNLLLLAISCNAPTVEMTFQLPDGWTQIATWDCMSNVGEMGWYYRFATSGEGSRVDILDNGADNETHVMFISEWTGIDGGDPFHDGATFTGSQVNVPIENFVTATLSGTREMLYITWGQWETTDISATMATVGNGFATTLNGHYTDDRFIQADYTATYIRPQAANWSHGSAGQFATYFNAAIIGFSGSHQGTVWVPPSAVRTRRGIMGGIYSGINRGIL